MYLLFTIYHFLVSDNCNQMPDTHIHFDSLLCLFLFSPQARIKTAKRRVVMASLYLGTGRLEQELVRKVVLAGLLRMYRMSVVLGR